MGKEGVTFEGFNHCHHPIMSANPQIIPLGDVMGQHHPRALANPGEHRK
jgi:hypothetical protein